MHTLQDLVIEQWRDIIQKHKSNGDVICKNYILGKCSRNRCRYVHPAELHNLKWNDGTQICVADLLGVECLRGPKCTFFHLSIRRVPCQLPSPISPKSVGIQTETPLYSLFFGPSLFGNLNDSKPIVKHFNFI